MSSNSKDLDHEYGIQGKPPYHSHTKFYIMIFGILVTLTVLTVAAAYQDFGVFNIVIAMVIASCKAMLVALFFMHLKYENPLTWLYAAFPLILLSILIGLVSLDGPFRVIPTGIRENGKPGPIDFPGDPAKSVEGGGQMKD